MKLSNFDEPLLLSGHTCYKTYAAKIILKKADIINLNEESTIPQLLGESIFYSHLEVKKFYLKLIFELFDIPNIDMKLLKVEKWNDYKEDILEIIKNIEEKMDEDSPFYTTYNNLKKKIIF